MASARVNLGWIVLSVAVLLLGANWLAWKRASSSGVPRGGDLVGEVGAGTPTTTHGPRGEGRGDATPARSEAVRPPLPREVKAPVPPPRPWRPIRGVVVGPADEEFVGTWVEGCGGVALIGPSGEFVIERGEPPCALRNARSTASGVSVGRWTTVGPEDGTEANPLEVETVAPGGDGRGDDCHARLAALATDRALLDELWTNDALRPPEMEMLASLNDDWAADADRVSTECIPGFERALAP